MPPRIREFVRFCIVGFVGFLVDFLALEYFTHHGFSNAMARIFSIAIALQVTYLLHAFFTFREHAGLSIKGWLHFIALNLIGALVNYFTFLAVLTFLHIRHPELLRFVALIIGTAVALAFNYWSNRRYVFTQKKGRK